MDNYLFGEIDKGLPKFNERVCNGLAVEQLKRGMDYVRGVAKCASKSFPEGLKFEDIVRCTPDEEYRELTRKRYGKHQIELSKSDVYLVKFLFSYEGKQLPPKYMFLPTAGPGGAIRIRGTYFYISPVLADRAISVEEDKLFIPLTRAKLNFERSNASFLANDVHKSGAIISSKIYNGGEPPTGKDAVKCDTLIAHYQFCQFGFTETLRRFCNAEIVVGGDEITRDNYSPDKWVICTSRCARTGTKPRGVKSAALYEGTKIRLAIRREDFHGAMVDYVAAFFYVTDHFPSRVQLEDLDEPTMWRIVLGKILKSKRSEGKLANEMDIHMASLNEYVDALTIDMLHRENIIVNDVWDLFHFIMVNMSDIMISADVSSMYDKRLTTLRYVLFDITHSIFTCMFALTPDKRTLNEHNVNETLNKCLKMDAVFKLNSEKHGETSTQMISGDNMFLKVTGSMVQQTKANDGYSADSTKTDPTLVLTASQTEVASYLNQPKSNPTGRDSINPFILLDSDDAIVRKEKFQRLLTALELDIRRR